MSKTQKNAVETNSAAQVKTRKRRNIKFRLDILNKDGSPSEFNSPLLDSVEDCKVVRDLFKNNILSDQGADYTFKYTQVIQATSTDLLD